MQILCCLNFPFHPEKDQKENFSPCGRHKMAGNTSQKNQMQVENKILEACPLHVLHEVCGGQVE